MALLSGAVTACPPLAALLERCQHAHALLNDPLAALSRSEPFPPPACDAARVAPVCDGAAEMWLGLSVQQVRAVRRIRVLWMLA